MIGQRLADMVTSEDPEQQAQAVELAYSLSEDAGDAARQVVRCLRISEEVWQLRRDLGRRWAVFRWTPNFPDQDFHMTEAQCDALRDRLSEAAEYWDYRADMAAQVLLLEVNQ